MSFYLYLKLKSMQRSERVHQGTVRWRRELDQQLGPARRSDGHGFAGSAEPQQNRISGRVPVIHGHEVRYVVALAPVLWELDRAREHRLPRTRVPATSSEQNSRACMWRPRAYFDVFFWSLDSKKKFTSLFLILLPWFTQIRRKVRLS